MSEVNADGVLLNPQEELKKEVLHLGGGHLPECPSPVEGVMERTLRTEKGERAGPVGGAPHAPVKKGLLQKTIQSAQGKECVKENR